MSWDWVENYRLLAREERRQAEGASPALASAYLELADKYDQVASAYSALFMTQGLNA